MLVVERIAQRAWSGAHEQSESFLIYGTGAIEGARANQRRGCLPEGICLLVSRQPSECAAPGLEQRHRQRLGEQGDLFQAKEQRLAARLLDSCRNRAANRRRRLCRLALLGWSAETIGPGTGSAGVAGGAVVG